MPIQVTSDQPSLAEKPQTEPEKTVTCASCGHEITRPAYALEVQGQHEHTFRNPGGYSFHVVCYSQAEGCLDVGQPTPEATWFPGTAWSFAICSACHIHLGWWYRGSELPFAGLIATRLVR